MNRHPWRALAAALAAGALVPAAAVASPPVSWTERPVREPEDRRRLAGQRPVARAQRDRRRVGLAGARRRHAAVPYYGYDGFTAPTVLTQIAQRGAQDRARQEHLPRAENGQPGADPNYDYGTHFLYQGHESGTPGA